MRIAPLALAAAACALTVALCSPPAIATSRDEARPPVGQLGPDGLPVNIPPPSSPAPSLAEWDAVPEVTVKGSSALRCQTKMVREWLRVTCVPRDNLVPKSVATTQPHGHQAFAGMYGGKASLVVQVVKGKLYVARFGWSSPSEFTKDLTVNWVSTGRPQITFD